MRLPVILFGKKIKLRGRKPFKDVYSFPSGNEVTITHKNGRVNVHSSIWNETERNIHRIRAERFDREVGQYTKRIAAQQETSIKNITT